MEREQGIGESAIRKASQTRREHRTVCKWGWGRGLPEARFSVKLRYGWWETEKRGFRQRFTCRCWEAVVGSEGREMVRSLFRWIVLAVFWLEEARLETGKLRALPRRKPARDGAAGNQLEGGRCCSEEGGAVGRIEFSYLWVTCRNAPREVKSDAYLSVYKGITNGLDELKMVANVKVKSVRVVESMTHYSCVLGLGRSFFLFFFFNFASF